MSPQTQVKVRVRTTEKNPKEPEVRTKVPKGVHKGNTSKAGPSGLEGHDDWSSVGWHEGWGQTYDISSNSFSLGGVEVSTTSSPKRFEWVKMNLATGAAVDTFPFSFGPEGAGDGIFYRTASGEWIPDARAWHFH